MKDLEIGQVLSLKIRYNNSGTIANTKHPYIIVNIDEELNVVEIAQLDSLAGKEYKAARRTNKVIYCDNPDESVIDKDSYVQLDNTILLEYFAGLSNYRRQRDKLSVNKLQSVLDAYQRYHAANQISEDKQVFMDEDEILNINNT